MAFVEFLDGAWLAIGLDFLLLLSFVGLVYCFFKEGEGVGDEWWDI